jgi:threonine dehydrogenase-like Zn-dependent dehydrogenase
MLAYTYIEKGKFALVEKPKPTLIEPTDAIVRVTMGSICTSDLHIKHGSVPRAVPGITVGHEMVGVVEEIGSEVTNVKPGDRVGKSSVSCPLKPSDSAPLKHSTMPP